MRLDKTTLIVTFLLALSACSLFKSDCPEGECETPSLLDQGTATKVWYCYGTESLKWNCKNQADDSQIISVDPTLAPKAAPLTVTPTSAQTLLDQPASSFAVQVIRAETEASVVEFAAANNIQAPLSAQVRDGDVTSFVLILGVYTDRQTADDASADFTRASGMQAQILSLGTLQAQIKQAMNAL